MGPTLGQNLRRQQGPLSQPPLWIVRLRKKSKGEPMMTICPWSPFSMYWLNLGSLIFTRSQINSSMSTNSIQAPKYLTTVLSLNKGSPDSHWDIGFIKMVGEEWADVIIRYMDFMPYKNQLIIVMQPENTRRCPGCKELLQEHQFKSHIYKCPKYDGILLRNARKLRASKLTAIELKLIIAEIDVCRQELEEQLQEVLMKNRENKGSAFRSSIMEEPVIDMSVFSHDTVECKKCHKKLYTSFDVESIFYVEECWHLYCLSCIRKYIDEQFVKSNGQLKCPSSHCSKIVPQYEIKRLLGEKKFDQMEKKAIINMMNIVQCAKCQSQYGFDQGNARDAPKKNDAGKVLSEADKKHYAENRFVCQRADCKAEQCRKCQAVPYHCGFSCDDFKKHAEMKKCRYCDEPLTQKNKSRSKFPALEDICNAKDCQIQAQRACTKILGCGHPCAGCKDERNCLPCLREECCKDNPQLNGQKGDDYCNICFVESLSASPCVRSTCGHIFHQKCLQKRFEVRWLTPRIFLNFCLCPLCKKWINLPEDSILSPQIKKNSDLFTRLQKMAMERLKFEELLKDEKLVDPKSPYYNKPTQYAMAIYAYFQCFKCKNPYFGGRKNCAQAMNDARDQGAFKPEELVCPNCCEIPIENCPKHGKDFIQFKCKFCCSTAQWFCWGNTHFCQPCHKRQCNGDYVSKYTKDKLPKCQGPSKCPVGGNHNGNGDEKSLGCSICRNYKENNKGF